MANEGYSVFGYDGIRTEFMSALEIAESTTWGPRISMDVSSDQEVETYRWLGAPPMMREWLGGRQEVRVRDEVYTIRNVKYESTMDVGVDEQRRDKYGQIMLRVRDMARKTALHWNELLSYIIQNGDALPCYDGQFFFDTDHVSGDSGVQTNKLTSTEVPAAQVAVATNPTAEELVDILLQTVQWMFTLVDDTNDPINQDAYAWMVMVPVPFMAATQKALNVNFLSNGISNALTASDITFTMVANPRISWTDKLALFRTDANVAPLIMQSELGVQTQMIGPGSEEEFKNDRHLFGVKTLRNVGFGLWQGACTVELST